jgi:hypothetical protein
MQYAIHAGVTPANVEAARDLVESIPGATFYSDGDGWNCWGDPPSEDVNDPSTRHVIAYVDTLGTAIDLAITASQVYADLLVPADPSAHGGTVQHDGTLVTVSLAEEWSEQYLVINTRGTHLLERTLRD